MWRYMVTATASIQNLHRSEGDSLEDHRRGGVLPDNTSCEPTVSVPA